MLPPPSDDTRHDLFVALGAWVEDKKTPTEVVATSYVDNKDASKGIAMQRPLCPYPQKAWYKGGRRSERRQQLCLREQAALTEVTTTEVERYPRHPQ